MTRKLGRTLEQFRAHYENKHLPLGHRTLPQIVEHCRNYVDQRGVMFPPGSSIPRLPRPGIRRSGPQSVVQAASGAPPLARWLDYILEGNLLRRVIKPLVAEPAAMLLGPMPDDL